MRKHRDFIVAFAMAGCLAPVALAQPPQAAPAPSMMSWMTASTPAARTFREQLKSAMQDLQAAQTAAIGKLELAEPSHLQRPLPERHGDNAAADYKELAALWRAKPKS